MNKNSKWVIAIGGPTASGKTELAIELAMHFNTEIVSCDSRQLYKEMSIGTAVPSALQLQQVKHHFIQSESIHQTYDAGKYETDANEVIAQIHLQKDVVVMVGGTGLYMKAALEGFHPMPDVEPERRQQVINEFEEHGLEPLLHELKLSDPEFFKIAEVKNPRRILRAIELIRSSGKTITELRSPKIADRPYRIIKIGIKPESSILKQRIIERVKKMIREGWRAEAEKLLPFKNLGPLQTVGYPEMFDWIENKISLETCEERISNSTRAYAKRQITWYKKDADLHWFDSDKTEEVLPFLEHQMKLIR